MPIPFYQPDLTAREADAVADVMRVGTLSRGPRLDAFERLVARACDRQHGVAVSSGTAGLHLAMLAANIGPGDEVITTPLSSVSSANCILYAGATPRFVDVNVSTMNLDAAEVARAIGPRTKAIVAVDALGHPGGLMELEQLARRNELTLIEDACDGFGGSVSIPSAQPPAAKRRAVGSFGRAGVIGFGAGRQLNVGEGGVVVTDDARLADACRSLRDQGRAADGESYERLGFNYRLGELSAAIGAVQCERLEEIVDARRRVVREYMERLMTSRFVTLPTVAAEEDASWSAFAVRLNDLFELGDRDAAVAGMIAAGIECRALTAPIHRQPYMIERLGHAAGEFPIAEHLAARTMLLPFFGALTRANVEEVCAKLTHVLERVLMQRKR